MAPVVPACLEIVTVFAGLFGTIGPAIYAQAALAVLFISASEAVAIDEVHCARSMRISFLPIAFEDAPREEERAVAMPQVRVPLTCVGGSVIGAQHAVAFSLASSIPEAHVDLTAVFPASQTFLLYH